MESIRQLEKAGSDFIVLPCNTLHSLLPELRKKSRVLIMDMVEEVSKEVKENFETVGILSTTQTRKQQLYDNNLKGINLIYPSEEEQEKVSEIIVRVIRKTDKEDDKEYIKNLIQKMKFKGAQKIILACTDLGNLISNEDTLDSTTVLINSIKKLML